MDRSLWHWIGIAFVAAFFLRILGFTGSFWWGFAFVGLVFLMIYITPQIPENYRKTAWILFLVFIIGYFGISFFRSAHPGTFKALQNQGSYDDFLESVKLDPKGAVAEMGGVEFCKAYEEAATNWYKKKLKQREGNFKKEFKLDEERVRVFTPDTKELLEESYLIKSYTRECEALVLSAQKEIPIITGSRVVFLVQEKDEQGFVKTDEYGRIKLKKEFGEVLGLKNHKALVHKDSDDKIIDLPLSDLSLETKTDKRNDPNRFSFKNIYYRILNPNLSGWQNLWLIAAIIFLAFVILFVSGRRGGGAAGAAGAGTTAGTAGSYGILRGIKDFLWIAVLILLIFFMFYKFSDENFINKSGEWLREFFGIEYSWDKKVVELPETGAWKDIRGVVPINYWFDLRQNSGKYFVKDSNGIIYSYTDSTPSTDPPVEVMRESGYKDFNIFIKKMTGKQIRKKCKSCD